MPRPANPRPKSNPRHSERSQTPPAPALNRGDEATADPARLALAWAHTARFLTTAAQLNQLPVNELPEVAFVGRSNAGKSTAINTLAQQRQLAYASKTPGRTQHINLFEVGPKEAPNLVWTDLPGYGYAAVEREAKVRWQQVMARYLEIRRNLTGVVQMVDSRHGFTELDLQLLSFVAPRVRSGEVKLLVLLTKADKLTRAEANKALSIARLQSGGGEARLFSALKKQGLDEVATLLWRWTHEAPAAPVVAPDTAPEDEPPALD